jgi:predicted GIY-YIG superfamily endonuclease
MLCDALPELRRKNVKLMPVPMRSSIEHLSLNLTAAVPPTKSIEFCPRCVLDMLHAVGAPPSMPSALMEGMRGLPLIGERPGPPARKQLERQVRYVYVLKNDDGSYYVGQTNDLPVRFQQHRDRQQWQTRGKAPSLVYFEQFVGERDSVDSREQELQRLNRSTSGQRRLVHLVERWRTLWRLLDLER